MDIKEYVVNIGIKGKAAARLMASINTEDKNKGLLNIAKALLENKTYLMEENEKDMIAAKENGLSISMQDRLLLSEKRIVEMSQGLNEVAALNDPIGEGIKSWKRPNELRITQVRVPLGVIGIIYEARPNVTVDATALCLKSGNSVILRGGSEALNSNKAIIKVIKDSLLSSGLPYDAVQLISITDREAVNIMMKLNNYIDVLIPRGGAELINNVLANSTVPVIQTGVGNCHIFVDSSADFKMAIDIIINAKVQRPAVCNAVEKVLIHKAIAKSFLPLLYKVLIDNKVEVRGDAAALAIIKEITLANEDDWYKEYNDLIIGVKVVEDIEDAIDHIYKYSSKHSEAIITENYNNSQTFLNKIDAACVYVNASTRFTDGFEFGFGAEIGISTQKLHARGPMGLYELTSSKFLINGNGQIRK
ncbi:MAG TPA: glutamate-5-semialdehyde dehydrogenase [Clostridiaceae bacterium]